MDFGDGDASSEVSMQSASGSGTEAVARPASPAVDGQASRWIPVQPPEPTCMVTQILFHNGHKESNGKKLMFF